MQRPSRARSRELSAWIVVLGLAMSLPRVAHADNAADRATARALAAEGQAAFDKGDYETAADRFSRADALIHAPTLLLALARSQVKLGKLVQANENYQRILREGVPANSPPAFAKAYEDAKKEADAITPRLAWVTISVAGSSEPNVVLDGDTPVSRAALDVKRAVNPGDHTVRVTADGFLPADGKFSVGEGESTELKLNLEPNPEAAKGPATGPSGIASKSWNAAANPQSDQTRSSGSQRTFGFVALGVGGAGLIVGGVTGLLAMNKHSSLESQCPNGLCPKDQSAALNSYRTLGTVSTVGFIVAGVGAAAGLTLILTAPKESKAHAEQSAPRSRGSRGAEASDTSFPRVSLTVGYDSIGLSARF